MLFSSSQNYQLSETDGMKNKPPCHVDGDSDAVAVAVAVAVADTLDGYLLLPFCLHDQKPRRIP